MKLEFSSLIDKRKKWVEISKENKFDFDSILPELYNDPSHFVYEILQNAEDEGAKGIRFELFENRLDVYHNGKDFDIEDIDGVTGIGISKKKTDLTVIGKFGIGFKSVFAITETPYIYSGKYHFRIVDFVVSEEVPSQNNVKDTLISLPFNHRFRSPNEVFTIVSKRLENIGSKSMLFLKNTEEIKWQTPSAGGHYLKESKRLETPSNTKRITIISTNSSEEYAVIEKKINIEGKELKVEVAYKLGKDDNGKEIIIPESDSKLVVYFPTEKVTYLNFLIQGPYKTTPNRENIPLEDEQNKAILKETANLVSESLSIIRDLGYLDTNFLNILPINSKHKESTEIYSVIYDEVKEKFLAEELLPASDNKYTKASNALLARGKELTEFLDNNDIQKLFSKQYWLDTNITYDKTRELRDYLINELDVVEVDFEGFARKITVDFLKTKSDDWMIDFYSRLLDQQSLWSDRGYTKGILRTKPIIRLENDEHIAPFDDEGKVQVYLPVETKSKYRTVKQTLTKNENSLKFLRELGLREPDLFAEIEGFIMPKYHIDNPTKDEWYFEDFEKLLKAYETIPANKKEEFMKELSKVSFIDSVENTTGENRLCKPFEVYFRDNDLIDYFNGYHSVFFVSDELYAKFEEKKLKPFFKDLGIEDKPRRIEIQGNLSWEEKSNLRGNTGYSREIHQKDYELEGLENFMEQMTVDRSHLLWKLLLGNLAEMSTWGAKKFFKGEYSWFYHSQHSKEFVAKFARTLRKHPWLIDKKQNFRKPSEITLSELSDDYIKESPNIDVLIKVFEFKPEIIEQLPENDRKILEVVKAHGITAEELEKIISERTKQPVKDEEKQWEAECEPDKATVQIQEVEPDKIVTPDLTGQGAQKDEEKEPANKAEENSRKEDVPKTQPDKKAIGRWGEEYVYKALTEKYQKLGVITETDYGFKVVSDIEGKIEIIWLNKHQDRGRGYDFVIKKNGYEEEYIEVKTKTEEREELIEVAGAQWEFARDLFEQNVGEKYSFYVVANAGKENAKITPLRNPIKLWKEGKLYAHPINFKL